MTETGKARRQPTTKSRRRRAIPVSAEALAVLKRRLAEGVDAGRALSGPLIPSTSGDWWPPTGFRRGLRRALELAGIDQDRIDEEGRLVHISPHALRRTVLTAIADEYGVEQAALHAGHSDFRVTQRSYVKRAAHTPEVSRALHSYTE